MGLLLLGLILLLLIFGAGYEALSRRSAAQSFPAPGKLVDIGGRDIHLNCKGRGSPTIILESALDLTGSLDWMPVHEALARNSRTCSYDRAGIMWSDAKSTPQDGNAVAEDLHAALAAAGERGPFVLVGHSIGGPYAMIYTRKYPSDVAGMVLVDAVHPEQLERFEQAGLNIQLIPPSSTLNMLSATRWLGLPRKMMQVEGPGIPPAIKGPMNAYAGISIPGWKSEFEGFHRTMRDANAARDFGDRPLVILTATKPQSVAELTGFGLTQAQGVTLRRVWREMHDEQEKWSNRSSQMLLPDSSHAVPWDRPDAVIAAVGQVVDAVRAEDR
ncbi:alpha/beta fold hydrolase [Sphingosinicella rhizophila]|uniref:alpha/beta fold hydrolase n=1 Tax=Sphingosinicella rhizophila TaxID=3050082 RepID=UPI0028EC96B2|nr:alpha/beta hydrolase [Sphingosinicella sp. GR2756]